jgi:hypothetical protein
MEVATSHLKHIPKYSIIQAGQLSGTIKILVSLLVFGGTGTK